MNTDTDADIDDAQIEQWGFLALTDKITASILTREDGTGYWYYSFGDGWAASVSARVMSKGERSSRSDGFCGYDWMVRSILTHGDIRPSVGA